MKAIHSCLDRLLNAAAAAPRREAGELPFAMEARVLAHWRQAPAQRQWLMLAPLLRRALACACLLMALAMAVSLLQTPRASLEQWTALNADVNLALTR
jgi:hypothetical protein